jgi:hypothetical protein
MFECNQQQIFGFVSALKPGYTRMLWPQQGNTHYVGATAMAAALAPTVQASAIYAEAPRR